MRLKVNTDYNGKVILYGPARSGKTSIAVHAAIDMMAVGNDVVWVNSDYTDSESIIDHFRTCIGKRNLPGRLFLGTTNYMDFGEFFEDICEETQDATAKIGMVVIDHMGVSRNETMGATFSLWRKACPNGTIFLTAHSMKNPSNKAECADIVYGINETKGSRYHNFHIQTIKARTQDAVFFEPTKPKEVNVNTSDGGSLKVYQYTEQ